jgi:polysaccharide biosynthesis/export protein
MAILSACAASHKDGPTTETEPGDRGANPSNQQRLLALFEARQHGQNGGDYVIAPGDLLVVTIYNFRPEGGNFESDVRVDDRGYISLPMIDPVHAAGMSLTQLRAAVVVGLRRAQVLNQPLVSVFLKDYQGQQVVVLGAVARPGMYHLSRGQQTLVDVLSMAGGLTQTAGNYLLFRPAVTSPGDADPGTLMQGYALKTAAAVSALPSQDVDMVIIDVDSHSGGTNPALLALPMRGGDLVIVPEAGQAYVEGEVSKPGPFQLSHGMTLTQLFSSAGGLTYPANRTRVQLIRGAATGKSTQWEIDLDRIQDQEQSDVLLERNDRVVVPATAGRKIAYGLYQTVTTIVRFTVGGAANLY